MFGTHPLILLIACLLTGCLFFIPEIIRYARRTLNRESRTLLVLFFLFILLIHLNR